VFQVSKDASWADAYFLISYVSRRFPSEDPVGVQAQKKRCRNWSFLFTVLARFLCGRSLKMRLFQDASLSTIYMSRVALLRRIFMLQSVHCGDKIFSLERTRGSFGPDFPRAYLAPLYINCTKLARNLVLLGGRSRAIGCRRRWPWSACRSNRWS